MASGGNRLMTGAFYGTGAELTVEVGFKPKYVRLLNVSGNAQAEHVKGMADAEAQKVVDSGAGATDISTITSNGITLEDSGFKLGADTDLNVDGELVRWLAWD